ncbi:uncharacterized protein LOC124496138 isoform X1 [Dermatophagoides farinae]|uniref:uncharacterized protein LOC124496138 isoform X1 n=1 Tax=Dermatophagoides farinae TaxID=6954 RepID=UPI003F60807D
MIMIEPFISSSSSNSHRINVKTSKTFIRLLVSILFITSRITSVSCMLDALKALFILTGASTYLVTKYVNISQQQQQQQTNGINGPFWTPSSSSSSSSLSSAATNLSWLTAIPSSSQQWPLYREQFQQQQHSQSNTMFGHHQQQQQQPLNQNYTKNGHLILMSERINFLKGDQQSSSINNNNGNNNNNKSPSISPIRPIYVLAIEEEEDERQMPKSLLNLSISADHNHYHNKSTHEHQTNPLNGIQVDYILDTTKIDDYAQILKYFALNRTTGELFLINPLDRDPPNGRSRWRFSIQARNRQTQMILAMADVAITVRDINDNKPLFEQKLYRTTLMENGPAGQILSKLHAIDFDEADLADNGKILYSLIKSPVSDSKWTTDLFHIDPHNGVLTVLGCCFDRERRSEYRLIARATDAGGLWDETKIVVTIGDLNDNPPKFLNPSRALRLNDEMNLHNHNQHESSSFEYEDENIFTFYISDEDLPESNHHHYEIINSTECPLFKRFYIVVNVDGSGTLYGTRRNESELRQYIRMSSDDHQSMNKSNVNGANQTLAMTNQLVTTETICYLDVVVRDSVRDDQVTSSSSSSGLIYEDRTTLTLVYQFNWDIGGKKKMSNKNNGTNSGMNSNVNSSNANAVIALDHFAAAGPKASDLSTTINNRKSIQSSNDVNSGAAGGGHHSSCSLVNGALCSNPSSSSSSFDDELANEPHHSFSSNVSTNNNGILFITATGSFTAFKQWLKWATNSKQFLIYASIIIFSNLIILLIITTFWLIRLNARRADNNESQLTINLADDYLSATTTIATTTTTTIPTAITTNNATYYQIPMIEQQSQQQPFPLFDPSHSTNFSTKPPEQNLMNIMNSNTNILFINEEEEEEDKNGLSYLNILKPSSSIPTTTTTTSTTTQHHAQIIDSQQLSSLPSYINC